MTTTSSCIGEYAPSSSYINGKNNDPYLEYGIGKSGLLLGKQALRRLRENRDFWEPTYLDVSELVVPEERPDFPADFEHYKETPTGDFFLHSAEKAALWYANGDGAYVRLLSHFLKGNGKTEQIGIAVAGSFNRTRRGLMVFDDTSRERLDEIIDLVDDSPITRAERQDTWRVLTSLPLRKAMTVLAEDEPTAQAS